MALHKKAKKLKKETSGVKKAAQEKAAGKTTKFYLAEFKLFS
ncbi:hypothetical protein PTR08_03185 [Serratia ureilytica]